MVEEGSVNDDLNFSILSGKAYFGREGNDILWSNAIASLSDGNSSWYIPSIIIGGSGADEYYVGPLNHSIVFDGDNGTSDLIRIFGKISDLSNFLTLDNRHLFITMFGGLMSLLVIDGVNINGSIEAIKFSDIEFNGSPSSISTLINGYSQGDYSIEDAINSGLFNPKMMGVDNALEVRSLIKDIYKEASNNITASPIWKNYTKNSNDYKFKEKEPDKYSISDGIIDDEITGLSFLSFADKDIFIQDDVKAVFDQVTGLSTPSGEMFRLYNAAFARFPDADGLKYWIEKFTSGQNTRRVVAESFLISNEFQELYGENISNEKYVETLYTNILGRNYDQEGYNYWLGNLNNGLETKYELLLGFAESSENKAIFSDMTGFF